MSEEPDLIIIDDELDALHARFDQPEVEPKDSDQPPQEYRSAFISDIHLGRADSKDEKLSVFLDLARLQKRLVLHGDAIDFWLFGGSRPEHVGRIFSRETYTRSGLKLIKFGIHLLFRQAGIDILKPAEKQTMRWKQSHNLPLQKTLRLLRKIPGIFVPGNHDELFRGFTNDLYKMGTHAAAFVNGSVADVDPAVRASYVQSPSFGNLDILEEFVYKTKGGQCVHVCHGDRFDPPHKKSTILGVLATTAYHGAIAPLMRGMNMTEREKRLTDFVNGGHTLKDLEAYYDRYADFLDAENKKITAYNKSHPEQPPRPLLSGGIHGHLHNPGIRTHRGYVFIDSGDWVDDKHCTAAVEHTDGRWQIMMVDNDKRITAHPSTPEPIAVFSARGTGQHLSQVPKFRAELT